MTMKTQAHPVIWDNVRSGPRKVWFTDIDGLGRYSIRKVGKEYHAFFNGNEIGKPSADVEALKGQIEQRIGADAVANAGAMAAKAMTVEYVPQVHCFVSFKVPGTKREYLFDTPRAIILHTGKFVWVNGSYADPTPQGVVQVGDGRDKGFSHDGDCVLSVPVEWVSAYYDENEAEQIDRCIAADQAMLQNAR